MLVNGLRLATNHPIRESIYFCCVCAYPLRTWELDVTVPCSFYQHGELHAVGSLCAHELIWCVMWETESLEPYDCNTLMVVCTCYISGRHSQAESCLTVQPVTLSVILGKLNPAQGSIWGVGGGVGRRGEGIFFFIHPLPLGNWVMFNMIAGFQLRGWRAFAPFCKIF